MRKKRILRIGTYISLAIILSAFKLKTPTEGVIAIIDSSEKKLYETTSFNEIKDAQFALMRYITDYLDANHNGYRFEEGKREYNAVMERFDKYNILYCQALSRFNPDLNPNTGNKEKEVQTIAIMKVMEQRALTAPNGFNPKIEEKETMGKNKQLIPQTDLSKKESKLKTSIAPDAIIRRTINDITLGKSTRQEVINQLKAKRIPYEFHTIGGANVIRCVTNIAYAGVDWDSVSYYFHNDIVFRIYYSKDSYKNTVDLMLLEYSRLKEGLEKKYSSCKQYESKFDEGLEFCVWDNHVVCNITKEFFKSMFFLSLDYTDIKIMGEHKETGYNEL